MKAVVASKYGKVVDIISLADHPRPQLKKGSGKMLVRVLTCSTSPGDIRNLAGATKAIRAPPSFPWVPSGDICGIIEEMDGQQQGFAVGDCVISSWSFLAIGGLAQFTIVDPKLTIQKPPGVSPVDAAALANSAVHALNFVESARIKAGERVMVIGGSGGLGTAVVQLVKARQPGFLATVSTDTALMTDLGSDRNFDYRTESWWECEEVKSNKFDVVFDCAQGIPAWRNTGGGVVKSALKGGRFYACVMDKHNLDNPLGWGGIGALMCTVMSRSARTRILPFTARWTFLMGDVDATTMAKVASMVETGTLKMVLHTGQAYAFTEEGVKAALLAQESYHAHGKVVVQIASA